MKELPAIIPGGDALPVRLCDIQAAIATAETIEEAFAYVDSAKTIAGSKIIRESIAKATGVEILELEKTYRAAVLWAGHRLGQLLKGYPVLRVEKLGLSSGVVFTYQALGKIAIPAVEHYIETNRGLTRAGLFRSVGLRRDGSAPKIKPGGRGTFVDPNAPPPPPRFPPLSEETLEFVRLLGAFDPMPRPEEYEQPADDHVVYARELVNLCKRAFETSYLAFNESRKHAGHDRLVEARKNLELAQHLIDEATDAATDYLHWAASQ